MAGQQTRPTAPPEPDENGDYESPALVALRRVWNDFCEEIATEEQVLDVVAEIGRFCQHNAELLESQIESGVSDPEDPGFALILEAFEMMLEACEYLALEFVEPDPEDEVEEPEEGFFPYGVELVQEATNQMMQGHTLLMQHIQEISEINCIFCSQPNSRENQRCSKCGRVLPQIGSQQPSGSFSAVSAEGLDGPQTQGSEGELTRNYVFVARAVSGWQSGHTSPEELAQVLEGVEQNLLAHLEDTERQQVQLKKAPAEQQAALMEAVLMTQEALDASLAAVERIQSSFENEEETHLQLGLNEFEEASRSMIVAYNACKAAAQTKE